MCGKMREFLRLSGVLYYLKPEFYSAVLMAMNILQFTEILLN
jgi:hypothetical protein